MTRHPNEFDRRAQSLRQDAESRLKAGSAPRTSGSPLDKDALARLYAMASDPQRSSDALRLLQELQVHQVELDLQREELENNERDMSRELALYKALFEQTPGVCLVATLEGRIVEANPAASRLLNIRHAELLGRTLHDFLKQESHACWNELLGKLKTGEEAAACEVLVAGIKNKPVKMMLSGSFLSEGDVLLFGVVSSEPVLHDTNKQQRA